MAISANRVQVKSATIRRRILKSSTKDGYFIAPIENTPPSVRWSFLLFTFTLPFESADLGFMSGSLSLAKISGLFFIAAYFYYHNPLFQKRNLPAIPTAFWWFLGYVAIYVLMGFTLSDEELVSAFVSRLFTLVQLMILFWVASNLFQEEKITRGFLLTYSIASVILALGFIVNLPGFHETVKSASTGRSTALGDDPNNLAILLSLSLLIPIGLCLNKIYKPFVNNILLPLMILPIFGVIVGTGSRSGVAAFMAGCSLYLLMIWRSKRRAAAIVLGILGIVTMSYVVISSPDFLERWQQAYYEGNLAGRDSIATAAIEMFLERPIFGWQPIEIWYELGFRLGRWGYRDTHNLFLHLLAEVGILGTFPFLMGLWLCVRAAYEARNGRFGVLPLALLVTMLTGNMAVTLLTLKPMWLILALALGTASSSKTLIMTRASIPARRSS